MPQSVEVTFTAHHDLDPVQAPQPRAVLERVGDVVPLGDRLQVDLVQHRLRRGVAGAARVVQPEGVVDRADQLAGVGGVDEEDLRVALASDAVEPHQGRVGVSGGSFVDSSMGLLLLDVAPVPAIPDEVTRSPDR